MSNGVIRDRGEENEILQVRACTICVHHQQFERLSIIHEIKCELTLEMIDANEIFSWTEFKHEPHIQNDDDVFNKNQKKKKILIFFDSVTTS